MRMRSNFHWMTERYSILGLSCVLFCCWCMYVCCSFVTVVVVGNFVREEDVTLVQQKLSAS